MSKAHLIATLGLTGILAGASPHAGAEEGGAAKPARKIDWARMNKDERKKYMKTVVAPAMKKVFMSFDAKKYANMSCPTCHGEGASEGTFKMPNPDLPKLPQPTDRAGFMALMNKKPDVVKFMGTKVKPKMAELLGLPEWTPGRPMPGAFSCYNCHDKEAGPAK